ncbi:hypothetical protein SFC66_04965 [Terribacillus saccharophilus]|uniref:hypothetical protein n=1 Tax=Terribacillus saccharophilus TaxID=361277 RepID=UPI00398283C4
MILKKAIGVVSGLLVLGVVLFFVYPKDESQSEPKPPDLQVQAGEETVTAKQGGYSWKDGNQAVSVDSADPAEDLDAGQALSAVSGAMVELDFQKPPQSLEVERKAEDGSWENQQVYDSQLELPELSDDYIYRISGQWEQGEASYAFLVKAE